VFAFIGPCFGEPTLADLSEIDLGIFSLREPVSLADLERSSLSGDF
jgi:hypothetical protein